MPQKKALKAPPCCPAVEGLLPGSYAVTVSPTLTGLSLVWDARATLEG